MGGSSSPLSVGSFLNGIGTNLVAGGNPITGALMNASMLASSGGLNGASSLNPASGGGFNINNGGGFGSVNAPSASSGYGSGGESLFGFDPTFKSVGSDIFSGIKGANTFMNQNPVSTQMGMQLAKSLLQEEPIQYAPSGQINRGQVQPMDYMSLLNPQQQTVIRPPQISLLG
jgi:hypothetical protein